MEQKQNSNRQEFWRKINANKFVKVGGYVVAALVGIYVLGKAARAAAYAVDGFKDLKDALKG